MGSKVAFWKVATLAALVLWTCVLGVRSGCNGPWTKSGLKSWSSSNLANKGGQSIVINSNQKFLFDMSKSPVYDLVTIDGQVVFANDNVHFRAKHVVVRNGGKLIIGSCKCPITKNVQITLFGTRPNPDDDPGAYGTGHKGIGVLSGGTLEVFGKLYGPSWTMLSSTAKAGSKALKLQKAVKWKRGHQVVIAPTDYRWQEAEVGTIAKVKDKGKRIILKEPLTHSHFAGKYKGVKMYGEVGLLTRHIKIQGNNAVDDPDGFGCHTMIRKGFKKAVVSGVEFTKCGQAGVLARYPFHWHLCGNVKATTFLKDCSFHHNFQRAVTIHGTDNAIVKRNVGYDTRGHMYFLEDGVERNNQVTHNLGIIARAVNGAHQLIPSDSRPSIFWISHPQNTYDSNHAAGCERFGFWYAMPVHPTGPSYTENVWPRRTALKRFSNNVAHSCVDGLFIDDGENNAPGESNAWIPSKKPKADDWRDYPKEAVFDGCTFYKNSNRGVWIRGGMTTVKSSFFADNAIGITFATNAHIGKVAESVFVGESPNVGSGYCGRFCDHPEYQALSPQRSLPKPWNADEPGSRPGYPIRGFEFYDGPVSVAHCQFWQYKWNGFRKASALSMLRKNQFSIAPTNDAKGIYITDGSVPVMFPDLVHDGDYASVFKDLDGTVTGREGAVVTNNNNFLKTDSCLTDNAGKVFICPDHFARLHVSTDNFAAPGTWPWTVAYLYRNDNADHPLEWCAGKCTNDGGDNPTGDPGKDGKSMSTTIVLNKEYSLSFNHAAPRDVTLRLQYSDVFKNKKKGIYNEVIVRVCLPPGSTVTFFMWNWREYTNAQDAAAREASSLSELRNAEVPVDWSTRGDKMWYQAANGYVYLRLINVDDRREQGSRYGSPFGTARIKINYPGGYDNSKVTCPLPNSNTNNDKGLPSVVTPPSPKKLRKAIGPIDSKTGECSLCTSGLVKKARKKGTKSFCLKKGCDWHSKKSKCFLAPHF